MQIPHTRELPQYTSCHTDSTATTTSTQVIVLPELATSHYIFTDADEARSMAIGVGAPQFAAWSAAAGTAW